jgi:uroporphyrinogen decarboxylase
MTHAERIIQAVNLKPTDRVPFALLSSGTWCIVSHGSNLRDALALPAETVAEWLHDGYTAVDSDLSWGGSGYNNIVIEALGGRIKWRAKGTPDVTETFFASAADADARDPAVIRENPKIQKLYEVTRRLAEKENGKRLVGGGSWGPFTLAGLLLGADALMKNIYKDRAAVEKTLRFATELYLTYIEGYIDAGAKVVQMAEPSASGDMISRKHFREVALPYIQDAFNRLSGKGVVLVLHICGNVSDRLDLLAGSGVNIMSLDYKVDLASARDAFDGKIAFSGNLNPVSVVQNGTPEEIVRETKDEIERVGSGHSYIVMPGCDIPPSTPLENLRLISKTVREYGFN